MSKFDKNKDETVKLVCDPKEAILNGLEQESSTQKLGLGLYDCEIGKKLMVCESLQFFFVRGEIFFRASENYTRGVHFESHLSEWRVLLKFHCCNKI